jgi:hypothetical protein
MSEQRVEFPNSRDLNLVGDLSIAPEQSGDSFAWVYERSRWAGTIACASCGFKRFRHLVVYHDKCRIFITLFVVSFDA